MEKIYQPFVLIISLILIMNTSQAQVFSANVDIT